MKYKITIEEIEEKEREKTKTAYVDLATEKVIDIAEVLKRDKEGRGDSYESREMLIGEKEVHVTTRSIYEQELVDLDVADLAMYINRPSRMR